ncbi:hypothetical protein Pint_06142 [Pistacia integerrima]|uniref:Uncharacterized protein n=1 Tax=Pistacia integerrima TaxID=434235 RepID=A0ACC0Z5K8_9ROSI|nr:hypothetical protein Pint_06142 [Pistacia integerrima]
MNPLAFSQTKFSCLAIICRIHHSPLEYVTFGKPNPFVFKNAEAILSQSLPSSIADNASHPFKTLYMIGDNPSVDIKGARQAGHPWFSVLTRTGVFKGSGNDAEFPADLASAIIHIYKFSMQKFKHFPFIFMMCFVAGQVVDTVEEAVDYILKREFIS